MEITTMTTTTKLSKKDRQLAQEAFHCLAAHLGRPSKLKDTDHPFVKLAKERMKALGIPAYGSPQAKFDRLTGWCKEHRLNGYTGKQS